MYSNDIILAGALYLGRDPDGELRAGGHRVQAPAQRPAGQHRPQVSTSTSLSWLSSQYLSPLCGTVQTPLVLKMISFSKVFISI